MIDEADVLSDLDQIRSRYEILRRLGYDGNFAVHAAKSPASGRHFAVKVMSTPASRSVSTAQQLWQAHTVEPLNHPKLMVLQAVHHLQGGTVAVAMERRRGCTLAERLEAAGPLCIAEAEAILRDIGEALAYLHERGVVHRGVRPESIFLDRDCGYARLAPIGISSDRSGKTMDEAVAGMLAYLAPEQPEGAGEVESRKVGPSTDLYSLGLVGYAMLAGHQPCSRAGFGSSPAGSGAEALPPLSILRPEAPAGLWRAIEGCLAKNPRRRWRSAGEFVSQLHSAEDMSRVPVASAFRDLIDTIFQRARKLPERSSWTLSVAPARRVTLLVSGAIVTLLAANLLGSLGESAAREIPERREAEMSAAEKRSVEQPHFASLPSQAADPPPSAEEPAPNADARQRALPAAVQNPPPPKRRASPAQGGNRQASEPRVARGLVLLGEPISR